MKEFEIRKTTLVRYNGRSKEVVIPEGVEIISGFTFADCDFIESVTLPASLKEIECGAFTMCDQLKNVTFKCPENLEHIESFAFSNTPWQDRKIEENGVIIIGKHLVGVSPKIEYLSIPETITHICGAAFLKSNIKHLEIHNGVVEIGSYAFNNSSIESIALPDSLVKIERYAFADCKNLKELILPKSVSYIGTCALYNLPETEITILNSNEDEEYIFDSCFGFIDYLADNAEIANVKRVIAPYGSKAMRCAMLWNLPFSPIPHEPKKYTYIDNEFCCEGTRLVKYIGNKQTVIVPDGITAIGDEAFAKNRNGLKKVILPATVKEIGFRAFSWCIELKTVSGEGVETIQSCAFNNCHNLQSLEFPRYELLQ